MRLKSSDDVSFSAGIEGSSGATVSTFARLSSIVEVVTVTSAGKSSNSLPFCTTGMNTAMIFALLPFAASLIAFITSL